MRPNKIQYLMDIARVVADRATCDRLRVGCVIADEHGHIVSTGYNGSAPSMPHCSDVGHLMVDGHCVRTIHAEANAVAHAAMRGVPLDGCDAYTTNHPCPVCLLLLSSAGVRRVYFAGGYRSGSDALAPALSPITLINTQSSGRQRIAFSGASGTGKTTLAEHVAEAMGIPMCPIGAMSVSESMGFANPYAADMAELSVYRAELAAGAAPSAAADAARTPHGTVPKHSCRWLLQRTLLVNKMAWEADHESFVTDRSIVDPCVYALLHAADRIEPDLMESALDAINRYDVVFHTPIRSFFNPGESSKRLTDRDYHARFEALIVRLSRARLVVLPPGTVEERFDYAMERLR